MKADSLTEADGIAGRLQALVREAPHLREPARLYAAILPILHNAGVCAGRVSLTRECAHSKLAKGLPLLHGLDLELDGEAMRSLSIELARAVEQFVKGAGGGSGSAWGHAASARRLCQALEEGSLDAGELLNVITAGERSSAMSMAERLRVDPDLLWTLGQSALKPLLRGLCEQLAYLADGVGWDKGYCFICGADAALGELQGNTQARHLRCGRCGADWLVRRLQCTYCGNEDHNTLGYFYAEGGMEKFRVEVCEKCKGYLKVVSAFSPATPEMLSVEDLATLHLDYIAEQRGYSRRPHNRPGE